MATAAEFGGGLCLIAGIAFRPACALILFTLLIAVTSILRGGYGVPRGGAAYRAQHRFVRPLFRRRRQIHSSENRNFNPSTEIIMHAQSSSRRKVIDRRSTRAVHLMLALFALSPASASEESELSLIKKNAMPAGTEARGAIDAPEDVSWKTVLSQKSDKDEPLIISGAVFQADGKTPAPNVLIYFYHTDSDGYYGREGEVRHGHFRGWLLTDEQGRYEISTIKPAPYPNRAEAAHIHMTFTGKNFREDSIDAILFEGDKFITQQERDAAGKKGGFDPILKLEKGADGILRGVRNVQLRKP